MFFLYQMKLLGLISLISIQATAGQTWKITVDQYINAELGSNVTILCSFSNPKEYDSDDVKVYWKTFGKTIEINDKDKKAFVYHPNETFMLENYRGRTKLIGDIKKKNCSLQIQEISPNDEPTIYMRLSIKENYSFVKNPVNINVPGSGVTQATNDQAVTILPFTNSLPPSTIFSTVSTTLGNSQMYMAIFIPVSVLLVIIVIAGIVGCIKHKRSKSITREESGYYANFSRASSNQAQREASCKNHENKKLSELKAIDEPVYINTEALTGQMDQSMDHIDNVYANVDYTK
ncbi:uncharacterized protein LOC111665006 isoform X1 [Seriola lalandi dorsalis]|uniref:uncharacterized protein LOC111665006 isoform X1 n=2 Tax=Seriola lalandi dorsalis TaxID=1841481 RepID=UPI000C6F9AB7|nr:uncharacterized protein LOC111665006 isoform X1 [Seriola lalandi dorsalis]